MGIKIAVITGRECFATERRMEELGVDFFVQGVLNKYEYLLTYLQENHISKKEVGYIGDDINDYKAMRLTGFIGCPADSCKEIRHIADYVSPVKGGYGAVRDTIEYLLMERSEWEEALAIKYNI